MEPETECSRGLGGDRNERLFEETAVGFMR